MAEVREALKVMGPLVTPSRKGLVLSPLLTSVHGSTFYSSRASLHPATKRVVAMHIYNELEELDSLFMDAGSANGAIAEEITYGNKQNFTILTNNVRAVRMFLANRTIRAYVTGGIYEMEDEVLVGQRALFDWRSFGCRTAFVGASAISEKYVYNHGLTGEELIKAHYWQIPSDRLVVPASIMKFRGQDSSRYGRLFRHDPEAGPSETSDEGSIDQIVRKAVDKARLSNDDNDVPGFRAKHCTIVIEPIWMIDEVYRPILGEEQHAQIMATVRTLRETKPLSKVDVVHADISRKDLLKVYPYLAEHLRQPGR